MTSAFTPQRIVSLQPSATVTLARLGLLERVVACTRYCAEVCPEVRSGGHAIIADSWSARSEQILAAHPELVIASVPYQVEAVVEILKSGARFLGLAPRRLADVYGDIASIAGIVGEPERGRKLIGQMQDEIGSIRRRAAEHARGVSGNHRPRVFCEEWGKPIILSQGWVAELVEAAGGEFAGQPGSKAEAGAVLRQDPEIVIAAWCGAGDRVPLEKIVRDRGWGSMRAARAGRVYCIRDELLNTPAPTLVEGLRALAAAIQPGCFPVVAGLRRIGEEPAPRGLGAV